MLVATDKAFKCTCDKCSREVAVTVTSREEAQALLGSSGWLEAAQKNRVRERWRWWCPTCAPTPSKGFGPTTSTFGMKR